MFKYPLLIYLLIPIISAADGQRIFFTVCARQSYHIMGSKADTLRLYYQKENDSTRKHWGLFSAAGSHKLLITYYNEKLLLDLRD